uniref:Angiotensin II receptor associated protein n=1 Tax=Cairina moschata TaxID=8855 RepID=A0A8C3CQP0_CAIMO
EPTNTHLDSGSFPSRCSIHARCTLQNTRACDRGRGAGQGPGLHLPPDPTKELYGRGFPHSGGAVRAVGPGTGRPRGLRRGRVPAAPAPPPSSGRPRARPHREAAPPPGVPGRAGRGHGAACRQPQGHHSGTLAAYSVFLTGLLLTVLTDIIHVSVFYPSNDYLTDVKRFSIGMAIFSLLLKPASCYFVYQMYRERGGEYTFNIGLTRAGQDRSTYEPIDQQDASPQWPDPSKAAPHPY